MKNILYLTEVSPFPTFGGKEIRRYSMLKALSVFGCNVHAIIGNKNKIDLNPFKMERVSFYEFTYKSGKLNAIFKYFKIFKKNRKLMRLIRELTAAHRIDIAFLDCYFIGQYISFFKKRNIPVIFGTENSQSRLTRMRTDKGFIKKIEKYTNYLLQHVHERLFFNRADAVLVVSDNDLLFHKKFVSENKLVIIPNFLDFSRYTPQGKKNNYIIMTGSFDAYQNKLGLTWFLENVWDDDLSKLTKLIIAGYHSNELLEKIKRKSSNLKNVYAAGEVEDITPYISQARIAIVPLLHGSGSRIKILEAMALKTLVISTSTGAEGIDHENSIIIVDKACDFKNEILKVIAGSENDYYKTRTETAYQLALKKYSLEVNRVKIEKILNNMER
ncbi:MAG: glycosyltransferase [Candidatus Aminicenantes bacterium]|nr:glycosyltransferase [Candidatus Aminicenantes bacterium]NIM79443.1 glycosyltransferase [Candidatus Aminicenantes bacterium]NIN18725.1 glycosyltransferase [Candidatus Aminicenantes bacterium]NIN42649.1 glycosyltransferase [Candidatus Aminicenantes bacterium]NIN85388.1 glycosyltransferase [Candidatus Aminicenantes bacterium]